MQIVTANTHILLLKVGYIYILEHVKEYDITKWLRIVKSF